MRWLSFLLVVLLPGALSFAGEDAPAPDSPEQAVAKVLAAHRAGDGEVLVLLAGRNDPDPFIVADLLLAAGEAEAALAFARAAPREDTRALPAYVESHRTAPANPELREQLRVLEEALERGDGEAALAAAGEGDFDLATVLGLRVRRGVAEALLLLNRVDEAIAAELELA